jgi:hypothetical protein
MVIVWGVCAVTSTAAQDARRSAEKRRRIIAALS